MSHSNNINDTAAPKSTCSGKTWLVAGLVILHASFALMLFKYPPSGKERIQNKLPTAGEGPFKTNRVHKGTPWTT